jgi:hypothetical protein
MPNYNSEEEIITIVHNVKEQYLMPNYNISRKFMSVLCNVKEQYLMPNYNISCHCSNPNRM